MITDESRYWLKPVFEFHKADTFRNLLPLMICLGVFTGFLAWLELDYLNLRDTSPLKNVSIMHGLLGFAISILLVFRTNTAYERWWEGRKLWGSLVNNSRNLATKLSVLLNDPSERTWFAQVIGMFAIELKVHLMRRETRLVLDERAHPELPALDRQKHVPNQVAASLMGRLTELQRQGTLSEHQLLFLNGEVSSFLDICGACERIKNTPIPYSYTAFIKKFIVAYVVTLPLGYVFALGWLAIPVVVFVFYVMGSLELIAEQIEDPFGEDSNDLPMERICQVISQNVRDILA